VADPRPTLDTVAQAAGVSRMTVSNAYNRPDQISRQTREKVLRLAGELGYAGPDPAGRSLRRRHSGTVGVVLTDDLASAFGDPGTVSFLHGVATELGEAGQALLLLPADRDASRTHIRDALVDAFVMVSLPPDAEVVADVLRRRLPVVSFGSPRLSGVPYVTADNATAAAQMAAHLHALGHRRFAVVTVGSPPHADSSPDVELDTIIQQLAVAGVVRPARHRGFRERVRGFLRELRDLGVTDEYVDVVLASGNGHHQARAAVSQLLARPAETRPTAIFAVTDVMAIGVMAEAAGQELAVPRDVSVAGFDGIEEGERSTPTLTTVQQSLFEQGRSVARLALDRVAGGVTRAAKAPATLVVRASTGSPPS
jgi:DNA-binding LacI/PurR family transcriptional regulator